jgi:putative endonuclease
MFYAYILISSKNNSYYIGCTKDTKNRLKQHNHGDVISTKNGRPWQLIRKEEYSTLSEARGRENQIKGWKSRKAIERLLKK